MFETQRPYVGKRQLWSPDQDTLLARAVYVDPSNVASIQAQKSRQQVLQSKRKPSPSQRSQDVSSRPTNPRNNPIHNPIPSAVASRQPPPPRLPDYSKSLCVDVPFTSARESILTRFEPVLCEDNGQNKYCLPLDAALVKAHGLLFTNRNMAKFEPTVNEFLSLLTVGSNGHSESPQLSEPHHHAPQGCGTPGVEKMRPISRESEDKECAELKATFSFVKILSHLCLRVLRLLIVNKKTTAVVFILRQVTGIAATDPPTFGLPNGWERFVEATGPLLTNATTAAVLGTVLLVIIRADRGVWGGSDLVPGSMIAAASIVPYVAFLDTRFSPEQLALGAAFGECLALLWLRKKIENYPRTGSLVCFGHVTIGAFASIAVAAHYNYQGRFAHPGVLVALVAMPTTVVSALFWYVAFAELARRFENGNYNGAIFAFLNHFFWNTVIAVLEHYRNRFLDYVLGGPRREPWV